MNNKHPDIKVPWAKGKLTQLLCEHDPEWYRAAGGTFQIISGERRYKICKKCGKLLNSYFARYE